VTALLDAAASTKRNTLEHLLPMPANELPIRPLRLPLGKPRKARRVQYLPHPVDIIDMVRQQDPRVVGNRQQAPVERIEPDHLVFLSEIAERAGLSRQAISLYTRAERGENFPGPVAKVTSKHPLWDWPEVAEWLFDRGTLSREEVVQARVVKEANLCLEGNGNGEDLVRRLEAVGGA